MAFVLSKIVSWLVSPFFLLWLWLLGTVLWYRRRYTRWLLEH